MVEFMSDASDIPILLDADTGYGNFNNARRLVRKLETRGVAGEHLAHIRAWSLVILSRFLFICSLFYCHFFCLASRVKLNLFFSPFLSVPRPGNVFLHNSICLLACLFVLF